MSYCLNPSCQRPENAQDAKFCISCGSKLLLKDRYRANRQLGEGGFGKTYLAVDQDRMQETCVIKQFSPSHEIQGNSVALAKAVELFNQEAMRLYELGKHNCIPNLLAYFEQDKRLYLVQEFIDGQNLLQELQQNGVYGESQIWQVLTDILPVLQYIHTRGVIHRDIKPENLIMRQGDRSLVLIDFGISKQASGTIISSNRGTIAGTPGYAPDEQIRFGEAYPASDLYALGATCVHLLTGIHPANLYNPWESTWLWEEELQQQGNTISSKLASVLNKLLQDRVGDRYQTVEQVIHDINAAILSPDIPPTIITPPKNTATTNTKSPSVITGNNSWHCVQTLTGHPVAVRSLAISPNGQMLASGSDDNTIKLWSLSSGSLLKTLSSPSGILRQSTWFTSLGFSPDSQILYSGSLDKSLKAWDCNTGKIIRSLKAHADSVMAIALTSDGKILATGSRDNMIRLWQLPVVYQVRSTKAHTDAISTLAITPDNQTLVSGSRDNTIKIWNLGKGNLLHTLTGHTDWIYSLAITPNGKILASGSRDMTIHLWDMETRSKTHILNGHTDWVTTLAIHPQGNILVSGSRDKTIKLWDLEHGQLIDSLTGQAESIHAVIFSPDGSSIISSSHDGVIKVWQQ
ncbi:WD40 repeat domain-containing serine/threonine-protein kinase [Calothrix sp. 336/3]|uniref:WD40 repeat domain-containing serine/threonine-protein kinase n=1 Tax=Calothrix sp. 336/3 TaxID=1337936 RepID=UPI0004E390E3|nr:WD40 repeat domain-containing serine/threonine-protein kinase [Calothrix sp. 336/3]AKG21049.1 hypothetical protein IJ00_06825 [Calothrix sp. 336/3]